MIALLLPRIPKLINTFDMASSNETRSSDFTPRFLMYFFLSFQLKEHLDIVFRGMKDVFDSSFFKESIENSCTCSLETLLFFMEVK